MVRVFGVLCAAALLAACQTKSVSEMSYSEVRTLAGEIEARCVAQGVRKGDANWKTCIDQEITREITMRRKNREAAIALGEGLQQAGAQMQASAAANRPRSCTSNAIGSTIYTNCY